MSDILSVFTLGDPSIQRYEKPVSALHSHKAQALLVYLTVIAQPQRREVLADLLWEGFSQQRAMINLRVVLSNQHKHLGDHLLITRDTESVKPNVRWHNLPVQTTPFIGQERDLEATVQELFAKLA